MGDGMGDGSARPPVEIVRRYEVAQSEKPPEPKADTLGEDKTATTLAIGEEETVTTMAIGEEQAAPPPPVDEGAPQRSEDAEPGAALDHATRHAARRWSAEG